MPTPQDWRALQYRPRTRYGVPRRAGGLLLRRLEQRPADDPSTSAPVRHAPDSSIDRPDRRTRIALASPLAGSTLQLSRRTWRRQPNHLYHTLDPPTRYSSGVIPLDR